MRQPRPDTPALGAVYVSELILSQDEIGVLTGRHRYRAQARALARMGISYKLRPDGFPIVSRVHFEQVMGASMPRAERATEPNWSVLDDAA